MFNLMIQLNFVALDNAKSFMAKKFLNYFLFLPNKSFQYFNKVSYNFFRISFLKLE